MAGLLACVFPGQGSQRVGMLSAMAEAEPVVRETFAEASAVLGLTGSAMAITPAALPSIATKIAVAPSWRSSSAR